MVDEYRIKHARSSEDFKLRIGTGMGLGIIVGGITGTGIIYEAGTRIGNGISETVEASGNLGQASIDLVTMAHIAGPVYTATCLVGVVLGTVAGLKYHYWTENRREKENI